VLDALRGAISDFRSLRVFLRHSPLAGLDGLLRGISGAGCWMVKLGAARNTGRPNRSRKTDLTRRRRNFDNWSKKWENALAMEI
jgi:hypothetical protein